MASSTPSEPGSDPPSAAAAGPDARRARYWRRGDEPEFGRILYFSDAVYAIALTLLALDLRVTSLSGDPSSPSSMLAALDDLLPQLVAFGCWPTLSVPGCCASGSPTAATGPSCSPRSNRR